MNAIQAGRDAPYPEGGSRIKVQTADAAFLKREGAFAFAFAGLISLATAHFVHYGWEVTEFFRRSVGGPPPSLQMYAPSAYRVFMPALDHALMRLMPWLDLPGRNALTDAVFLWATLWALYKIAVHGTSYGVGYRTERCLRVALTFLFAVSALAWITQYQRAETAPTALYLAVCVLCLRRPGLWPVLVQLAWTVLQAFTRADVPLSFGVAMVAASFIRLQPESDGRRRLMFQGVATAAIAVLVQGYLQFIRFPHLSYDPQTPVFQLPNNLLFHMWSNALVAILPVWLAVLYGLIRLRRIFADRIEVLSVIAAALYIPLWSTVGSIAEVRIYIPFLLLMSPVAARCIALALGDQQMQPGVPPAGRSL